MKAMSARHSVQEYNEFEYVIAQKEAEHAIATGDENVQQAIERANVAKEATRSFRGSHREEEAGDDSRMSNRSSRRLSAMGPGELAAALDAAVAPIPEGD